MSARQADIVIRVGGSSAATIEKRATALDRLAVSLAKVNVAMKATNTSASAVVTGARKTERAVQSATKKTDAFGTSLRNGGNALDQFGTLFRRMIRIMASYFVITTVITAFREFVTVLAEAPARMELWNTQLRVLSGSATLAAKRMELLKDVAIETPLELPDLLQGLTSLEAFHVEISERTLPLLTDLAAVTGRTFEEVSQALGKVIAGSPQAITRSLPVLAIDPMEFKALAAELGSRSEALWQIIQRDFEGFAKESATTVIGIFSNIKDAWFVIMAELGEGAMDAMRDVLQSIMDWLQELRKSPQALEEMRSKVRGITDSLVQFGKVLVTGVSFLNNFTAAVGGVSSILKVFAALLTLRVLQGLYMFLAGLNPVVAIIGVAIPLISTFVGKLTASSREQRLAALEQKSFADELERTNRLMERNTSLVSADLRRQQGVRIAQMGSALRGMDVTSDRSLLQPGGIMAQQLGRISTVVGELPEDARSAIVSLNFLVNQWRERWEGAFILSSSEKSARSKAEAAIQGLIDRIAEIIHTSGGDMIREAKSMSESLNESIKPPQETGEIELALERLVAKFRKAREEAERLAESTALDAYVRLGRQVTGFSDLEEMRARVEVGLTPEVMLTEETTQVMERLRETIRMYLESGDPIQVQAAIELMTDLQPVKEQADEMSTALENVLRQGLKTAADNISKAMADGGFMAAIKTTFGAALNLLGDALIQFGIGLIAWDKAVKFLDALNPATGAAVAIAGGIALKAFANTLMKNAAGGMSGGGGGYSPSGNSGPSSITYPTFNPSQWSMSGGNSYNIYAWDSKSMKTFLEDNENEFGNLMGRVVKSDKETGGAKYGLNLAQAR